MHLPRLVLIADRFTEPAHAARAVAAVEAGARWVHLRDHQAGDASFRARAEQLVSTLRAVSDDLLLSINTRLPVAAALQTSLHVGTRGPTVAAARAALGAALIGLSAHTLDEVEDSAVAGVDYFFVSPIFPTGSKPDHPGLGLDALRRFTQAAAPVPVYALGGITPERISPCVQAGAHGVAVLSGILHADDPAAAVQTYLHALSQAPRPLSNTSASS